MKELIYDFYGFNEYLFLRINEFCHQLGIEVPLYYISKIFDIEKFAIYYVVIAAMGYWWFKSYCPLRSSSGLTRGPSISLMAGSRLKGRDDMRMQARLPFFFDFMMKLGTSYATFGFTYAAIKFSVNMPRPFCTISPFRFHTIADVTEERCLSSFPSSHTGLAFLISLFLWPYLCRRGRIVLILIIVLVALSRMSLAMHYPADILYSMLIAYLVFHLSKYIYRIFENNIFKWMKRFVT